MIPELRDLIGRVTELERRLANIILDGVIAETDHSRDHYRVRINGETGQLLSPWIARGDEDAGVGSTHRPMAPGQQVRVISRDGELGAGTSLVYPGSYRDRFPQPSQNGEAFVTRLGDAVITMKAEAIELTVGSTRLQITADEIVTFGKTRLNDGGRAVHYVGGRDTDGDRAVDGADQVLV
jgi:phage baseplate assembly protein V